MADRADPGTAVGRPAVHEAEDFAVTVLQPAVGAVVRNVVADAADIARPPVGGVDVALVEGAASVAGPGVEEDAGDLGANPDMVLSGKIDGGHFRSLYQR